MCIPDAPWIREAERRGTDYMYEFLGYREFDDGSIALDDYEDEEEDEQYFDCDREDLEMGFNPYTGSYDYDC